MGIKGQRLSIVIPNTMYPSAEEAIVPSLRTNSFLVIFKLKTT